MPLSRGLHGEFWSFLCPAALLLCLSNICFLELGLMQCNQVQYIDEKPSKGQLTIFYAGTVNVYDDVPIDNDKAQAILLLAGDGENSHSAGHGLPIARKFSLQHFLEKRRQRIINKSPYASYSKEVRRDQNEMKSEVSNENKSICFINISF